VATRLLWIVLPMIFFTTSAVVVQGALEAHKRFTISAIAPVLFNLCVLAGAWILGRRFGIEGLAYGFLFGSVVQLAVQLPSFHRLGLAPGLYLDLKHPAVRQVLWLMLPIFLDNLVVITVRFVENNLASHLESGSISALGYALRLHGVPVGLFAYGLVTVILPYLSTHHETRNHDQFRKTSSFGMRGLLLLCTPIMVLFLLLARDIVDVIYRHEVFDEASAEVTAHVFRLLSIGLVAQGLTLYFCKVLYALRNTFVILKVSIFVATLNVLFDLVAVRYLGVGAIALGASLAWSANAAILFWILHRHGHALDVRGDAGFLVKIALAGIVTAVVVAGTDAAAGSAWNVLESSLGRCVILGGLGSVAFLAACAVSRIEELRYVTRLLRSRRPGGDTGGERR
jgi:putative peptidoglycan lipid II flippase